MTDSFTEKYFGRNKRIPITIPESKATDAMSHLKSMQKLIESEADSDNYPCDLENILDEMLGLVNKTLYLLTLVLLLMYLISFSLLRIGSSIITMGKYEYLAFEYFQ